jgi:hypothetical protein
MYRTVEHKNSFFFFLGPFVENGGEVAVRRLHGFGPGKTPNGRGSAAGVNAREILSTFGSKTALLPQNSCQKSRFSRFSEDHQV